MNNLTQTQQDAKQAFLDHQQAQMLVAIKTLTQMNERRLSDK